jgi:SAM-dependent methyltransferase
MGGDPIPVELDRLQDEYARRARTIGRSRTRDYWFYGPMNGIAHTLGPINGRSVLDIGCGSGTRLMAFRDMGAGKLAGIDLIADRCALARQTAPDAEIVLGSAHSLPWPDRHFDIVSQFLVFTSILDPILKQRIALEMMRVLKPSGVIVWHDFRVNNPRNRQVKGIRRAEICALFPFCNVDLRSILLAPPLASVLVRRSPRFASMLEKLPFLRTHYLGFISPLDVRTTDTMRSC